MTVLLCCCMVEIAVAGKCGVSAPEISLSEIVSDCDHEDKGRITECVAAMHRFCGKVKYPTKGVTHFGVSQEAANGQIGMACVPTKWYGDVSINTLTKYNSGCSIMKSQHRDCLSAMHQFCEDQHGSGPDTPVAGISQEVGNGVLQVHCFEASHMEHVSNDVLQHQHPGCPKENSDSADCFAAASRWCQLLRYSGGITLEADTKGIQVACYNADFTNVVFVKRTTEFYEAGEHIVSYCDNIITFNISEGTLSDIEPDTLKMENYDNTHSSVDLVEHFIVSKDVSETSSFTQTHSLAISEDITFTARTPTVFGGGAETSISSSHMYTKGLSLTKDNTVTKHYSDESLVTVPPGQAIVKMAVISIAHLDVPWSAKVLNGLGAEREISGRWKGVSTYNLDVVQKDKTVPVQLHHYTQGPVLRATDPNPDIPGSCPTAPCSSNLALCPSDSALCSSPLAVCTGNFQCACGCTNHCVPSSNCTANERCVPAS